MIETINLELTTECPLNCPQCYCPSTVPKYLSLEKAKYWLKEAAENDCQVVALSGGETLCYPYLYDVIEYTNGLNMKCSASFSGVGFSYAVYSRLVKAGISEIHISLNGSCKEINSITRDGFYAAIKALEILKFNKGCRTAINWVMHDNNCDDFPNIVKTAERYGIDYIQIIGFKPDSHNELKSIPSVSQMKNVVQEINNYHGPVTIIVESCYSQLRALLFDKGIWGNYNIGKNKGCIAGNGSVSVNVDGMLCPCRHLRIFEKYTHISDYLEQSPVINIIKQADKTRRYPCSSCQYKSNCRHCLATNLCLNGELYYGDGTCSLYQTEFYRV